jgi:hypothetical protein
LNLSTQARPIPPPAPVITVTLTVHRPRRLVTSLSRLRLL